MDRKKSVPRAMFLCCITALGLGACDLESMGADDLVIDESAQAISSTPTLCRIARANRGSVEWSLNSGWSASYKKFMATFYGYWDASRQKYVNIHRGPDVKCKIYKGTSKCCRDHFRLGYDHCKMLRHDPLCPAGGDTSDLGQGVGNVQYDDWDGFDDLPDLPYGHYTGHVSYDDGSGHCDGTNGMYCEAP
jgi:hypothetical protein